MDSALMGVGRRSPRCWRRRRRLPPSAWPHQRRRRLRCTAIISGSTASRRFWSWPRSSTASTAPHARSPDRGPLLLQGPRVHGLRVMPNWDQSNKGSSVGLDAAGRHARRGPAGQSADAHRRSGRRGLVVDVTFYLTAATGVATATASSARRKRCQARTNILFDLQNESRRHAVSPEYGAGLRHAGRRQELGRFSGDRRQERREAARLDAARGAVARERPRPAPAVRRGPDAPVRRAPDSLTASGRSRRSAAARDGGRTPPRTRSDFQARFAAQGPSRPIYFQEPSRFTCGKSAGTSSRNTTRTRRATRRPLAPPPGRSTPAGRRT